MRTLAAWVAIAPALLLAGIGLAAEHGAGSPLRVSEYTIPAANGPRDPWPHSAGGVYFSMAGDDRIVRFDVATRQFRDWRLPAGTRPHGVAVAGDGMIFYAGFGDGTIGELDPRTGSVQRHGLARADSQPYAIALDAQGNVWVTLRGGAIAVLNRSSGRVKEYPMDGEPYGLAFDRNGTLWVTCISGDTLRAFNPRTGTATEVAFDRGAKPRRLSVGADGRVWVSLYGSGRLAAVDAVTGKLVRTYPMPGGPNSGPYSVSVGPGNRVWVTEFQTDTIAVLDPASGRFSVTALSARSGVRNAALDAAGRLWFIGSTSGKIGLAE